MSTWVKVYNSMPSNPKLLKAGERAGWLYVCGLCYANEHLTNGFIARHVLPIVAPSVKGAGSLVRKLVAAGLWNEAEGGWQIHDYEEHQRTAEEVRVTRSWDVERKSLFRDRELVAAIRGRDNDRCRYCGRKVNWLDRRGECGGTYDHVIPRGGNTFENVVVACKQCNSRKGARTPEQARMPLRELEPELDPDPDPIQKPPRARDRGRSQDVDVDVDKEEAKASSRRVERAEEKSSDDDNRLCRLLAELATARNPKFKVKSRSRWLTDMRLLRDRDENSPGEIEAVIRWTFTDTSRDAQFWADVIRSPSNLRMHFPQIWSKMQTGPQLRSVPVEDSEAFLARRGVVA